MHLITNSCSGPVVATRPVDGQQLTKDLAHALDTVGVDRALAASMSKGRGYRLRDIVRFRRWLQIGGNASLARGRDSIPTQRIQHLIKLLTHSCQLL